MTLDTEPWLAGSVCYMVGTNNANIGPRLARYHCDFELTIIYDAYNESTFIYYKLPYHTTIYASILFLYHNILRISSNIVERF